MYRTRTRSSVATAMVLAASGATCCGPALVSHAVDEGAPTPERPWVAVQVLARPLPSFGPVPTSVGRIDGDRWFVGGVRVDAGGRVADTAADVELLDAMRLGGRFLHAAARGNFFVSGDPMGRLEPLPIGGEELALDAPYAFGDDGALYVATRSGLAFRVRDGSVEPIVRSRTVIRIDPADEGVHATVTPGLVVRVGDDGTESFVGRRPGVSVEMATLEGEALPEIPFPADASGEETPPDATARDEAYRGAVRALGFDALSGDVVSPFDTVGFELSSVERAIEDRRSLPSYRVFQDGTVVVVGNEVTQVDRAGAVRLRRRFYGPDWIAFSGRYDRFVAVGCDDESHPRIANAHERACLYDGDAVRELPWSETFERVLDGRETATVVKWFLLGDELGFVVRDGSEHEIVRVPIERGELRRERLAIQASNLATVSVESSVDGSAVFLHWSQVERDALVRIEADRPSRVVDLPSEIYDVAFVDGSHGIAAAIPVAGRRGTSVLRTDDGGATWSLVGDVGFETTNVPKCSPVACVAGAWVVARPDVAARLRVPEVVRATESPMRARLVEETGLLRPTDPRAVALEQELPRIVLPRAFVGREIPSLATRDSPARADPTRLRSRVAESTSRPVPPRLLEVREGVLLWTNGGDDRDAYALREIAPRMFVGFAGPHPWLEHRVSEVEAFVARLGDESGFLTRRGWIGPLEFHGLRGAHRLRREVPSVRGWCDERTSAGAIVVTGVGTMGPLSAPRAGPPRAGEHTWEIEADGACLRRATWTLTFDRHVTPFGTVVLERSFAGVSPTLLATFTRPGFSLPIVVPSPEGRGRDIRLGARADCGSPFEPGTCADDTVRVPAELRVVGDRVELVPVVETEYDYDRREEAVEASLPDWIRRSGGMCACATCTTSFEIGGSASREPVPLVSRSTAPSDLRWSGSSDRGLIAAAQHDASIELVAIRDGIARPLPNLPLTACPGNLLAVDATSLSVLVTDCPIDESGAYVRFLQLRGERWVDRIEPLDARLFDADRIRGAIAGDRSFVFAGTGARGVVYRSEGVAWTEVPFDWVE